jgi:hypothetical protein
MILIRNKLSIAFALLFSLFCAASAHAQILLVDETTGDLEVNVMPTAIKIVTIVVAVVTGFLTLKFIGPIWSWITRMISGK